MSHYTRKYSGNDTKQDRADAMTDIKAYLGDDNFERLAANVRQQIAENPDMTLGSFRWACSFAGIRGYPCKVWFRELGGTNMKDPEFDMEVEDLGNV